jgi:hypothetical protein
MIQQFDLGNNQNGILGESENCFGKFGEGSYDHFSKRQNNLSNIDIDEDDENSFEIENNIKDKKEQNSVQNINLVNPTRGNNQQLDSNNQSGSYVGSHTGVQTHNDNQLLIDPTQKKSNYNNSTTYPIPPSRIPSIEKIDACGGFISEEHVDHFTNAAITSLVELARNVCLQTDINYSNYLPSLDSKRLPILPKSYAELILLSQQRKMNADCIDGEFELWAEKGEVVEEFEKVRKLKKKLQKKMMRQFQHNDGRKSNENNIIVEIPSDFIPVNDTNQSYSPTNSTDSTLIIPILKENQQGKYEKIQHRIDPENASNLAKIPPDGELLSPKKPTKTKLKLVFIRRKPSHKSYHSQQPYLYKNTHLSKNSQFLQSIFQLQTFQTAPTLPPEPPIISHNPANIDQMRQNNPRNVGRRGSELSYNGSIGSGGMYFQQNNPQNQHQNNPQQQNLQHQQNLQNFDKLSQNSLSLHNHRSSSQAGRGGMSYQNNSFYPNNINQQNFGPNNNPNFNPNNNPNFNPNNQQFYESQTYARYNSHLYPPYNNNQQYHTSMYGSNQHGRDGGRNDNFNPNYGPNSSNQNYGQNPQNFQHNNYPNQNYPNYPNYPNFQNFQQNNPNFAQNYPPTHRDYNHQYNRNASEFSPGITGDRDREFRHYSGFSTQNPSNPQNNPQQNPSRIERPVQTGGYPMSPLDLPMNPQHNLERPSQMRDEKGNIVFTGQFSLHDSHPGGYTSQFNTSADNMPRNRSNYQNQLNFGTKNQNFQHLHSNNNSNVAHHPPMAVDQGSIQQTPMLSSVSMATPSLQPLKTTNPYVQNQ